MHELSITQSLVDAVLNRTGERPVTAVNLMIGPLSGVLADAVRFCFDVATAGTPLAGARLQIDEPQGRGRCRSCQDEFTLTDSSCCALAEVRTSKSSAAANSC